MSGPDLASPEERKPALDQIIEQAERGQPWTFTKHGKPVAVLIGYDDLERLKEEAASFHRIVKVTERLYPDEGQELLA